MHFLDRAGLALLALPALVAALLVAGCGSDARTVAQGPLSERAAPQAAVAPMAVVPRLVGRRQ
jgi:hypothetical protein